MVWPLPSMYLYDEFVSFKIPTTFNDMEQFTKADIPLEKMGNLKPLLIWDCLQQKPPPR